MSIFFPNDVTQIKCAHLHSHMALSQGELQVRRQYYFGLQGTSEIVGTPAFWVAKALVWLNDPTFTTRAALNTYRDTLRGLRGTHGELREKLSDDTISEEWAEATFEGFEEIPFDGHRMPGPILDPTGQLGWFTQGIMTWTLLSSDHPTPPPPP